MHTWRINGGVTMQVDPIIEEIHSVRQEHAEKFNYNISKIFSDLKDQEKKSERNFVSLPIKRVQFCEEKKNSIVTLESYN